MIAAMPDNVGNSLNTATPITLGFTSKRFSDSVELGDNDYYRFTLKNSSSFNLSLTGLTENAEVELLNSSGAIVTIDGVPQVSTNRGALVESINTFLDAGTYYIRVYPGAPSDPLDLSTTPSTTYNLDLTVDDGKRTDIVWRRYADAGNVGIWRMNGTNFATADSLLAVPDLNWQLVGAADFNKDGIDDLVWRYTGTDPGQRGQNGVWIMAPNNVVSSYLALAPELDLGWEIRGVADINQDGNPDLLWRKPTTGENGFWLLGDVGQTLATVALPGLSGWDLQGIGDFNGDGSPDLIWRTQDKQNAFWFLDKGTFVSAELFVDDLTVNKRVVGTGDFNGDGLTDILWRNFNDGSNEVWLMKGPALEQIVSILGVADLAWRPIAPYSRNSPIAYFDIAGNSQATSLDIGPLTGDAIYRDQVGSGTDALDSYRFSLGSRTRLSAFLDGPAAGLGDPLQSNLDLELFDSLGNRLRISNNAGNSAERLTDVDLNPGTYSLRVLPGQAGAVSRYELRLQVNNLPVLVSSGPLTLTEGTSQTISNTLLRVNDENNTPSELRYTLVTPPNAANGSLSLDGALITAGSVFSQADINRGKLSYRNNGGESLSDTFVFSLTDGQGGNIANTTFTVNVVPVNDPPELLSLNRVTVSENATFTISSTTLLVTDVEQPPLQIIYSLTNLPTEGDLFLGTRQLTSGNTFSQADINSGRLAYKQNGSEKTTDNFSFSVTDGAGGFLVPQTQTLSFTIQNVNDAPELVTNTALTVTQGGPTSITNTLLRATDAEFSTPAEQDRIIYSVTQLPSNGTLTLNGVARLTPFTLTQADLNTPNGLQYQHNGTLTNSDRFTFTLSDGSATSAPLTYDIFVPRQVSTPPGLRTSGGLTVSEGTTVTVSNAFLQVTDVDSAPGFLTYTLASSPSDGTLNLRGIALTTGQTFTQANIDSNLISYTHNGTEFGATGTDQFTFTFRDQSDNQVTTSSSFAISLIGVNDPPTLLTTNPQITVTEGLAENSITSAILRATDPDNPLSELTYTLLSSPTGQITRGGTLVTSFTQADIDAGVIKYVQGGSEATSDSFSFEVRDRAGTTLGPGTFNISVVPVNDAPGLASFSGLTVSEGDTVTFTDSNLLITDNDGSGPLVYTIGTAPTSGTLRRGDTNLTAGSTFIQEDITSGSLVYVHSGSEPPASGMDTFTFTASDSTTGILGAPGRVTPPRPFTISLVSVNDLPVLVTPTPQITVTEGLTENTLTSNMLRATDNDNLAAEITYSLISGPTGRITRSGTLITSFTQADIDAGVIKYVQGGSEATSDSFSFELSDRSGTPVGPTVFNINVVPVNDAPGLASFSGLTVNEGETIAFTDTNLLITDNDGSGPLVYTIGSAPTSGTLRRGDTNLTTGGTFTQDDITNGALVYVHNGNEPPASGIDTFTFTASDSTTTGLGAPGRLTPPSAFTFNILPINDAPTVTAPASVSVNEEATFPFTGNSIIRVTDPDGLQPLLAEVFTSSGGILTLGATGGLTITGGGNNSSSVSFTANTLQSLNNALNNLRYRGLPEFDGIDELVLKVDDQNGGVTFKTITMNVIAVNDAPTLTVPTGTITINEDTASSSLSLTVTDVDADNSPLKVTISSSTTNGLVTVNESGGGLSFINGTSNGSSSLTFTGTLSDIQFALNDLTYQGKPDFFGSDRVTVTIDDQGATGQGGSKTVSRTLSFNVLSVNDKPTFVGGADLTTNEDGGVPVVQTGWAKDIKRGADNESGQALRFAVTSADTTLFNNLFLSAPVIDPATGDLRYTIRKDANGVIALTAVLSDNGGTANGGVDVSDPFIFTLNVRQVNDAPSFTTGSNVTVNEDAGFVTLSNWATNVKSGPTTPAANESTQSLNFLIETSNDALFSDRPQINIAGDKGTLVFRPADDANGIATVTLRLQDDGGTENGGVDISAPQIFTINVRSVNDRPTFSSTVTTVDVLEDAGTQTVQGFANSISAGALNESGQRLTFSVTPSSANATLFNNLFDNTIPSGGISGLPTIDATTGNLTYRTRANANGSIVLTATLRDDGGTANGGINTSTPYLFTLNVGQVNDAPSFTLPTNRNQTISEDSGPRTISSFATAVRSGPTTPLANESTQTVSFLVNTDNTALFSALPDINSAGRLTYTVAPNAFGTATVTVSLQDNGGTNDGGLDTSAPQTFVIQVNPVNDAPTLTVPTTTVTVSEDGSFDFSGSNAIQLTDIDSGESPIRVTLTVTKGGISIPASSGLSVASGANGGRTVTFTGKVEDFVTAFSNVVYTPDANYSGNDTLTVTVNDQGNVGSGGARSLTRTVGISVTAENDAPELVTLNNLVVSEGGNRIITNTLLRTTDVDNTTAQLRYTVGTAPTSGILRVSAGAGFTTLAAGSVFTQADIDSSRLSYVQNGSETETDLFTFAVSDGAIALPESTFNISVIPVNDAPRAVVNQVLTLSEGDTSTIANTFLSYTDNDNTASQLVFTITSAPTTGMLRLSGADLTTGSTFTQEQLDIGVITYEHSGSETQADSFNFSVGDGVTSTPGSFNISVSPVNDQPILISSGPLTVNEGALMPLQSTILNTSDPDTPSSQVVYTLTGAPIFGTLQRTGGTTLTGGSTFTQAEINSGAINYKHNGSENPTDVFVFQVSDGGTTPLSGIVNINVNPVNDAPTLVRNTGLSLSAATQTSRVISSSQLQATDVDNTNPQQVLFRLVTVPNSSIGVLKLGGVSGQTMTVGQTFSQSDIQQGRVVYQYLGGGTSDGFQFSLVDSGGATGGSGFFQITFTS
jgi:Cadherin-like/Bacterial pre-peptidase C-terminal domain/FG-GAP-like repeat/Bacterial Ig domain/Bacterial cadherin-like domain